MNRCLPIFLSLLCSLPLAAAGPYLRVSVGAEEGRATTFLDRDCSSTNPPALFGCVEGNDGRPLGARGEFETTASVELAAGVEIGSRVRAEVAFAGRPTLDLEARADFIGVAGQQPVSAPLRSSSLMVNGALDVAPSSWRVQPFVTGGVGVARNEVGPVWFSFPGISDTAVTVVRGGTESGLAWSAGVGAAIPLSEDFALDIVYRHTDLGDVRTDDGMATIVRPTRVLRLAIAGIEGSLETRGVTFSLRYRMR